MRRHGAGRTRSVALRAAGLLLLMTAPAAAGPPAAAPAGPEGAHPGRTIVAGPLRLFVETEGSGPPLVLLPAIPGVDHAWFHPYLSSLAPETTVVYYDAAGCGRSEAPPGPRATLEGAVADLEALREALGHERIDLLGHGFGAAVAVRYAERHPQRAGRLILVGPSLRAAAFLTAPGLIGALTPEMRKALEAIDADRYLSADGRLRQRIRILAPLLFRRLGDRGFHRAFVEGLTVSAGVFEAIASVHPGGEEGADLLPALRRLEHPVLIVAGRHDLTAPPGDAEAVRRAIPKATLVVLEESGALPFADQPVDFLRAVRTFLGSGGPDPIGRPPGAEKSGAGGGI